ncbi:MAG TPA: peptidylprolyl isomerase, partial [Burkholderiaceae bacterium]|nr:peptidylprolyl isomerase [Burkholderiaceae bacterium]
MTQASARHILVDSEEKCKQLKTDIENGADFAAVAKEHSSCPSSRDGGNLGT